MNPEQKVAFRSFLIELLVYAALVFAYFFSVIGVLSRWVHQVYQQHKIVYAFAALLLIVIQGVGLEIVTTALLKLIRSRTE
ncbi:MAG TPA: hypothetical protein VKF81_02035 [Blastocatellia bacterium]|nr:hypothetical protein [Blastocatellia bacterium]